MKENIKQLSASDIIILTGGSKLGKYLLQGSATGAYSFATIGFGIGGPAGALALGTAGVVYGAAGGGLGYLVDRRISGRR